MLFKDVTIIWEEVRCDDLFATGLGRLQVALLLIGFLSMLCLGRWLISLDYSSKSRLICRLSRCLASTRHSCVVTLLIVGAYWAQEFLLDCLPCLRHYLVGAKCLLCLIHFRSLGTLNDRASQAVWLPGSLSWAQPTYVAILEETFSFGSKGGRLYQLFPLLLLLAVSLDIFLFFLIGRLEFLLSHSVLLAGSFLG